jgi:hypothetical protein
MRERPTGITILAILAAISGVLSLLGGLALFGLGGLGLGAGSAALAGLATISGVVLLALGIAYLALAYGFWTLKPWAWMVLNAVMSGDIVAGLTGGIISIVISAIILYYLFQPSVKAAFGRS